MIDPYVDFYTGNCLEVMATLPEEFVQTVVTSPPYWGLRKYDGEQDYIWNDHNGCEHEFELVAPRRSRKESDIVNLNSKEATNKGNLGIDTCLKCGAWEGAYGLEPTVEMYVDHSIEILRGIKRVLRKDGIVWWNIGDTYNSGGNTRSENKDRDSNNQYMNHIGNSQYRSNDGFVKTDPKQQKDIKPKDLCLIPFRVAIAAQQDGWYVRSVIIWSKPNPMPESVKDRPTESHEYILMLTKSSRYYFDMEAIREKSIEPVREREKNNGESAVDTKKRGYNGCCGNSGYRNIRSVWEIATQPFPKQKNGVDHFATFPEEISKKCILASTSEKGNCAKCGKPWARITKHMNMVIRRSNHQQKSGIRIMSSGTMVSPAETTTLGWQPTCNCNADVMPAVVLDPFGGSGTTHKVAKELGRKSIYIDMSEKYLEMAKRRIEQVPLPMIGVMTDGRLQ